ncbi:MAG: hypothetical protein IVW55_10860 [Chloroflexi bacterium]|nr:hypothetical protein [Chloroflexota bacterium]
MPVPSQSTPSIFDIIKPWDWNFALELATYFIIFLLVGGIWLWTRSASRKNLPDILGRNVEDFAGVAQEGNGPLPVFLLVLYIVVALFIIGYPAVTMIFGYKY